ncbi:hypothetical protein J7L09_01810 [bacterium]|nr:hypothetical protein [bacterium]
MRKKEIELNFLHICDYASICEGGKLSIIGIFKNINVKKLPAIHPQMFIVTNISLRKHGEFEEVIKIVNDQNQEIRSPMRFKLNFPSKIKKKEAELGVIARVENLQFKKEGEYKVQVYINNDLIAEKTFNVLKR